MPGQITLDQIVQGRDAGNLFNLYTVEKPGQGIGEIQRAAGIQFAANQVLVIHDQARQLKPPPLSAHRRWQV